MVAILTREPDGAELLHRLERAERRFTSAMALYESVLGIARLRRAAVAEAQTAVDRFVEASLLEIVPITGEIGRLAVEAFGRYGRGLHPARLNMGDCFAYACARSLGVPLLCKGDDFPRTDIFLG